MSKLDKYGRYDPMARHPTQPKKSNTSHAEAEAWLKKHGNGMTRIQKDSAKSDGF